MVYAPAYRRNLYCEQCGHWRCDECGWQRKYAWTQQEQWCFKCKSAVGKWKRVRHQGMPNTWHPEGRKYQ